MPKTGGWAQHTSCKSILSRLSKQPPPPPPLANTILNAKARKTQNAIPYAIITLSRMRQPSADGRALVCAMQCRGSGPAGTAPRSQASPTKRTKACTRRGGCKGKCSCGLPTADFGCWHKFLACSAGPMAGADGATGCHPATARRVCSARQQEIKNSEAACDPR